MKAGHPIALLTALILGAPTHSPAQPRDPGRHEADRGEVRDIHARMRVCHERIDRGIADGRLTRPEAHRLKNELDRVRDDEARMRRDGRLTRREADRLERELGRLERHISELKHNSTRQEAERVEVRDIHARMRVCHERIDRGLADGRLTRPEAHRLKGELDQVRDDEARMRRDGRLTRPEADRLERELSRLERHISELKRNDERRRR